MPVVISNSSPLIHLAKIERLDLLERLYERIIVPTAVWRESVEEGHGSPDAAQIAGAKWISVAPSPPSALLKSLQASLGAGESEAIALAVERKASLTLMDEMEGRSIARTMGLNVTGVIGVLLASFQRGWIDSLERNLDQLADTGFRLSAELRSRMAEFTK